MCVCAHVFVCVLHNGVKEQTSFNTLCSNEKKQLSFEHLFTFHQALSFFLFPKLNAFALSLHFHKK